MQIIIFSSPTIARVGVKKKEERKGRSRGRILRVDVTRRFTYRSAISDKGSI